MRIFDAFCSPARVQPFRIITSRSREENSAAVFDRRSVSAPFHNRPGFLRMILLQMLGVVEIRGNTLSTDASLKLDDREIKFDKLFGTAPHHTANPESAAKTQDFTASGFATTLKLTVNDSVQNTGLPALADGPHTLTIINPDGKLATWPFKL